MHFIGHLPVFLPSRWQLSEFWPCFSSWRQTVCTWGEQAMGQAVFMTVSSSCSTRHPMSVCHFMDGFWREAAGGTGRFHLWQQNRCKRCLKPLNSCKFLQVPSTCSQICKLPLRAAGHCAIHVWMISAMLMDAGEHRAVFECERPLLVEWGEELQDSGHVSADSVALLSPSCCRWARFVTYLNLWFDWKVHTRLLEVQNSSTSEAAQQYQLPSVVLRIVVWHKCVNWVDLRRVHTTAF